MQRKHASIRNYAYLGEEVGKEVPSILWFSTVFCSFYYMVFYCLFLPGLCNVISYDGSSIERAPGEDGEVIL